MSNVKSKVNKHLIWKIIEAVCLFALIFLAVYFISRSFTVAFDMPKNKYALRGVFILGISVLVLQRFNVKNWRSWIPVGIIVLAAAKFFLTEEMLTVYRVAGRDIWGVWNGEWACAATYAAILADGIFEKKLKKFSPTSHIPMIMTVLGLVLYGIFTGWNKEYIIIAACFLVISLISFSDEKLNKYGLLIAAAIISCNGWQLIDSLIRVPYTGETFYRGTYLNSIPFAMIFGLGICACLFFAVYKNYSFVKRRFILIPVAVMSLVFIYGLHISSARTVLLAVIVSILFAVWIVTYRNGKVKLFFLITAGIAVVALAVVVIGILTYKGTEHNVFEVEESSLFYRLISRFWLMIYGEYEPYIVDFERNSLLYRLNVFTSGRMELWVLHLARLHPFAGNIDPILWYNDEVSNAHNTYIQYMFTYGVIPAVLILSSWIWGLVGIVRKAVQAVKRHIELNSFIMLALIIVPFCYTIFLNEACGFESIVVLLPLLFISMSFQNSENNKSI